MRWSLLVVVGLVSCATAEDDQLVDWGDPPRKTDTGVTTTPADTSTTPGSDTGAPPSTDSSVPSDETSTPDTSVEDTGDFDAGPPADTSPPPFDTGPSTGTCMWCTTGNCPTPFVDYACLLNCLSDGYFDCNYDAASSMPCTCAG